MARFENPPGRAAAIEFFRTLAGWTGRIIRGRYVNYRLCGTVGEALSSAVEALPFSGSSWWDRIVNNWQNYRAVDGSVQDSLSVRIWPQEGGTNYVVFVC